ncbi:VCBS repeat-containing protein [Streptomyces sp. NPDC020490]|uniref:VCBS repeat-containing protein n=1 Tax=Streptomyces sp. NPDC020490 TaxID=3365078 RepID=UPI0037BD9FF0
MAGITALAAGVVPLEATQAAAATCTASTSTDFNGDGIADTVIGDPNATVDGAVGAGLVHVVLGGGKGVSEISQSVSGMNARPETNDHFGLSRAFYDADGDGCTDLVVGAPYEDVASGGRQLVDAGAVYVIHGSPTGIGAGSTIEAYTQASLDATTATEAYDWFGYALKAGETAAGSPYLVIGVPGENVTDGGTTYTDAGCIEYVQDATKASVSEKSPGVPGIVETNDRFGYSLAGTNRYFAVGGPGEAIGDEEFAGGVTVFNHTFTDGVPTALAGIGQGTSSDTVPGVAEAGDAFGTSISMTNYRPSGETYNSDALLVAGTPGEDIDGVVDTGSVTVVRVQPSGTYSLVAGIDPKTDGVDGTETQGDFFGQRVAIANTNTSVVTSTATVRLAVGIPGREADTVKNAGAIQIFRPLDSSVGTNDKILTLGSGLPGTATARDYTGVALTAGSANLYVGVPYSKATSSLKGVLHVLPWTDVDGTTSTGTTTYLPGSGGLPDAGEAFGVVG